MTKKKILVVEDELDVQKALRIRLEACNWEVVVASDGEEGLQKIKEEEPDLILLDIMLPKMNGYKVCRSIKFNDKYRHIPVIMLTVRSDKRDIVLGLNSGADEYLTKPYSSTELIEKIKRFLGR